MLREIIVDLDNNKAGFSLADDAGLFGKALAVRRLMEAEDPDRTIYLTGYTPLSASGLGFAGKMNVYGISLLGKNLQGSRSGGLIAGYLTRHGIVGIRVIGETREPHLLVIDKHGESRLVMLDRYGGPFKGTSALASAIYEKHGDGVGLAITDPASLGFLYNAIVCNTRRGGRPNRAASRSTTRFGRNGLIGVAVEHAAAPAHELQYDRGKVSALLRRVHGYKFNENLAGRSDEANPLLGGTYGASARIRFDLGHSLTNLFRSADVPEDFYGCLLPENIVRDQIELSKRSGINITRHSCVPGCPNRCVQMTLLEDDRGEVAAFKSGEWETYQGVINLGVFAEAVRTASWIIEHSNELAYDHIEALVTLAALALVTEVKADTGVRYGDAQSMVSAMNQAVDGSTELGMLIRQGAAAVEQRYGIERHFTIGGHALPFHNGRAMLQTGVGLSWTFGRHGECAAGPGRHNFLGLPYDPTDHGLEPRGHVLNAMHGMVMYGALDEHGICFFMGPNVDTLAGAEAILNAIGVEADARSMVRDAARTILDIRDFNASRGVQIQPLPRIFYEQPTRGNRQTPDQAVAFNVPFDVIRDYGLEVLVGVARGEMTIPDELLQSARQRYE